MASSNSLPPLFIFQSSSGNCISIFLSFSFILSPSLSSFLYILLFMFHFSFLSESPNLVGVLFSNNFWCDLPHLAVFIIFVIFSAIKWSIFFPLVFRWSQDSNPCPHGSDRESSAFTTRPGGFPKPHTCTPKDTWERGTPNFLKFKIFNENAIKLPPTTYKGVS